jgi:hypothetical protein
MWAARVQVSRTVKSSAALRTRYRLLLTYSKRCDDRDFGVLCFAQLQAFAGRFGGIRLASRPATIPKKSAATANSCRDTLATKSTIDMQQCCQWGLDR